MGVALQGSLGWLLFVVVWHCGCWWFEFLAGLQSALPRGRGCGWLHGFFCPRVVASWHGACLDLEARQLFSRTLSLSMAGHCNRVSHCCSCCWRVNGMSLSTRFVVACVALSVSVSRRFSWLSSSADGKHVCEAGPNSKFAPEPYTSQAPEPS